MKKIFIPTLIVFLLASVRMQATNPIPASFESSTLTNEKGFKLGIVKLLKNVKKQVNAVKRFAVAMTNKATKFLIGWLGSAGISLICFIMAVFVPFLFITEWFIILYLGFLLLSLFFSLVSLAFFVLWIIAISKGSSASNPGEKSTPKELEEEKRKNRRKKKRNR